jgi:glucosamine--fructose-6-phosphate aminotransferase (isomerizing)
VAEPLWLTLTIANRVQHRNYSLVQIAANLMPSSYLNDLLDQPSALQATIDSLSKAPPLTTVFNQLKSGKYQRVILTGMGSSFHGLYPLQLRLFALPIGIIRLETAELIHYARELINPANLIVAVSQSGQSAEMVQLLELTYNRVTLVGVTNTPTSALADQASLTILTCAGEEATVSCKTYISTLAALTWLGDQLMDEPMHFSALAGVPQKVAEYWADWHASVEIFRQRLAGVQQLFLLGRGNSMAATCTGALIIKEAARFGAEGMNSAAFRHGPLELISPHTFALVYLGADETSTLNSKIAQDILAAGGLAEPVSMREGPAPFHLPICPLPALPIMEILPAQMLSLALADIQGLEAGRFIRASKVTMTE